MIVCHHRSRLALRVARREWRARRVAVRSLQDRHATHKAKVTMTSPDSTLPHLMPARHLAHVRYEIRGPLARRAQVPPETISRPRDFSVSASALAFSTTLRA